MLLIVVLLRDRSGPLVSHWFGPFLMLVGDLAAVRPDIVALRVWCETCTAVSLRTILQELT